MIQFKIFKIDLQVKNKIQFIALYVLYYWLISIFILMIVINWMISI